MINPVNRSIVDEVCLARVYRWVEAMDYAFRRVFSGPVGPVA